MDNNQRAVLTALIYSDLFSFPLTLREVRRYVGPGGQGMQSAACAAALRTLSPFVRHVDGYYCLRGREGLIRHRQVGAGEARRKEALAVGAVSRLRRIPTVRFIGLSGSVAAGKAKAGDDIDLFIITKHRTLFITRFFVVLLLELFGMRRHRGVTQEQDKICVNFFLDERAMAFPSARQDLYTAREIAQMVPLFDRHNTYQHFLRENHWMRTFLPQATALRVRQQETIPSSMIQLGELLLAFPFPEVLLKRLQLWMIAAHKTTETVTDQVLAFHPRDYRAETLRRYRKKLQFATAAVQKQPKKTQPDFLDKAENIFYTA